jgi:alpha-tubulin suppressor-like RCC1 family protein
MHSLALTSIGRIFAWGVNNFGQLGEGTNQQQISPTAHSNFIGPTSGRVDDYLAVEYN